MLIGADIVEGIFAAWFDSNFMVGDIAWETMVADIVIGYEVPCNSNAKGGEIVGEITCHQWRETSQGETSLEVVVVETMCCAMATLWVR